VQRERREKVYATFKLENIVSRWNDFFSKDEIDARSIDTFARSNDIDAFCYDIDARSIDAFARSNDIDTLSNDTFTPSIDVDAFCIDTFAPSIDVDTLSNDIDTPSNDQKKEMLFSPLKQVKK